MIKSFSKSSVACCVFVFCVSCCLFLSAVSSRAQNISKTHSDLIDPYKQYVKIGITASDYKNDTLKQFFNDKWEKCKKKGAFFYVLAYPIKEGWACENYDLFEKRIFSYIVYADQNLTTLNGPFYSFHNNDSVESRGRYVNNKMQGTWVSFDKDGKLTDSCYYNRNKRLGNGYFFFPSGRISNKTFFDEDGTGTLVAYRENGTIRQTGFYTKGELRDSTWTFYNPEGKVSVIQQFKNDSCLTIKCYNVAGALQDSCEVETMPEYAGGLSALLEFLSKNLKWPRGLHFTDVDIAKVVAKFAVDVDGSISDIRIVRHVAAPFDNEVVRVIKAMPNWKPGISFGEKVRVYYTLPVRFRQD
jgi:protein TonB